MLDIKLDVYCYVQQVWNIQNVSILLKLFYMIVVHIPVKRLYCEARI